MSIILSRQTLIIYILGDLLREILNKSQNKSGIPIELKESNSEGHHEKVNIVRICFIVINDSTVKDHG